MVALVYRLKDGMHESTLDRSSAKNLGTKRGTAARRISLSVCTHAVSPCFSAVPIGDLNPHNIDEESRRYGRHDRYVCML